MYRWLAVAALGAGLIATPVWGQRHGGGGGFGGHSGFSSHGSFAGGMTRSRGSGFSGPSRSFHFGGGFHRPFSNHPHFASRRRFFGYGGYGYPYYGYPFYNDDSGYDPPDNYVDYGASAPEQGDSQQLQAEINRLEDEVARLRQERSSSAKSQAPAGAHSQSLTELVFQDKHTQEVQNYAIVGQTFWIFDSQLPTKVSLSELDVPATIKANDARGVGFQLPR
jgi:hypothetical protein